MTHRSVGWTLILALGTAACQGVNLCIQEELPSLRLTVRPSGGGDPLTGVTGTAISDVNRTFACPVEDGAARCWVNGYGESVDLHLEREGYLPWDSANVRLMWSDVEGCNYPILKQVETEMVPDGGAGRDQS